MKIAEGVYRASNPIPSYMRSNNCYLLAAGDDCYLVDTGWPPEAALAAQGKPTEQDGWQLIMALFAEAGRTPQQLSGIIITHYHPDHSGYVEQLRQLTGAPVLVGEQELAENALLCDSSAEKAAYTRRWYEQNGLPEELVGRCLQVKVNYRPIPRAGLRALSDGEIIRVGAMRWQVVWTPGHTWGHICLWEPQRAMVLTGDHIIPFNETIFVAEPWLYTLRPNPRGAYLWAIDRVAALGALTGLSGHGEVMWNFPAIMAKRQHRRDRRYEEIPALLREGEKTLYQIALSLRWLGGKCELLEIPHFFDLWMAVLDVGNHLCSLEARGVIRRQEHDGLLWWSLSGDPPGRYDGVDPRR